MPKHAFNRTDGTSNRTDQPEDERIGLTEAFAPVGDASAPADDGEDSRIGLTEAFAPVPAAEGAHAGGFSYRGDADDEYPDALDALEPRDEASVVLGAEAEEPLPPAEPAGKHGGKKHKPEVPAYQRKSRRMRKILIAIVVLLVLMGAALVYFAVQWVGESQRVAVQQTQEQQGAQEVDTMEQSGQGASDAGTTATKTTEVPNLASLLGMTVDEAVAALERGATVTSTRDQNEEGNPIRTNVTIALTDEPADTRSGTPTVYLGLSEEGRAIQVGYSAATASLGYGTLSFADAVRNEHVVEKTLREAGITVSDGAAQLPADKTQYSTYASDGTTLTKENCSFSGTVELGGAAHEWSSVLLYDYSTANMSGNLADTIRIIYVYINS